LSVDFYESADPSNIRFHSDLGGGVLLDMGCYLVNISRTIMGSEPIGVSAHWNVDPKTSVDTSATAILRFERGRVALISCSMHANGQGTYSVIGTKGIIEVPRAIIPGLGTRAAEGLVFVVDSDGNRVEERFSPVDQYQLMIEAFSTALLSDRTPPVPISDAVRNMLVLDAIAASSRSGAAASVQS
jgi:predicted dehydrogenase